MTITTCDVCKRQLAANYRNDETLKGSGTLLTPSETKLGSVGVREFDFEVVVKTFRFSMTNFHVCNDCIMEAVSRAVGNREAA